MLLRRFGNKTKIVNTTSILSFFPAHDIFIDMFFGAGGVFFNKPLAKYNICNDLDSDVFNLFTVVTHQRKQLEEALFQMPIHDDLWQHWKRNPETDPILKALRFVFLSNFGHKGKSETLRKGNENSKQILYKNILLSQKKLEHVQFTNCDFRQVVNQINFHREDRDRAFIYADPPYLDTTNNYAKNCKFSKTDVSDLFDTLVKSGIRFAMSEFDHPYILELVQHHKLNVVQLCERRTIGNRRTEILITNYQTINLFNHQ